MNHALTAAKLLTPNGTLDSPLIFFNDGRIDRITTRKEATAPAETLDLQDAVLSPAFLDVHVHGAAGADLMMEDPAVFTTISRYLATRGVGEYLATTVTAPVDHTLRALDRLATLIEKVPERQAATPIGIHLEGPFISHEKRGVHPPAEIQPPSIDLFDRFYDAARGHILLMTIAPEIPGAVELIAHAHAKGVKLSLGHSNAKAAETNAGIAAGAISATHIFNAMRALDHREPGIAGVVLDNGDLYAELICDGIHVVPEMVRLWFKAKGAHRCILITDGMAAMGMPDGTYTLGGFPVEVNNGVAISNGALAGSVLTMDKAVANLMRFTQTDLATSVGMATTNPAAMLGLSQPQLAAASRADLNIFNPQGVLTGTILQGELLPR